MPKRKKPAAADLPMGDEAAAASSEAPQREVKFKKTRRGGKHWKRKVLRDARWLEQQKLNDAASDKEDEENTEAAKKEGSEEATAWTDAELLDAWTKGETVVLPKGVRIDPRGHPEYEAIVRDLHAALPPKEDKPEQSQQAHYLRRRLRPVPTASDYVNDEDDQKGTFFQQKKSQPSSSSKGPSPSERTAEEYPPLSVDSSSEEPQEKQQNRWDKIPKSVRDPPPLKGTASRGSGTPASIPAKHQGQIYSDVKPKENVKEPPPGPKAQLKSREQRERQREEAAETTSEERPPIPTPTHLASIDLHRVLDTLGIGSAPPGEEETGDIPDDYLFEVRRLCQLGYRPTIISFIGAANEAGLKVIVEIGVEFAHSGSEDGNLFLGRRIQQAMSAMAAGAAIILVESEGLTENRKGQPYRWDALDRIASSFRPDQLMFEADDQDVLSRFIDVFGPKVNLMVDHSKIEKIEAARRGYGPSQSIWGKVVAV